ncbi:MAG: TldD/PmbA family protein [Actinomycetota bacterium]
MEDLVDLGTRLVAQASSGEAMEAFLTHERSFEVKVYGGEVESLSSAEPRGAGLRVVDGGRMGFAFTTDLTEGGLEDLLERARDNALHATPDEAVTLAGSWTSPPDDAPGLMDDSQVDVMADDKVGFALELERATKAVDKRIRTVEEAAYADTDTVIAIATSTGIASSYRRTDAWCYSVAIATEEDDTEVGFDFGLARGLTGLDADAVAGSAAGRALDVLGATKIPSARMAVVLDPYTAGQFLGVIGQALTGEAVQKGRSLFAGKLGTEVAHTGLTLIDDGRLRGAPGSAPWDAEGVPTQRTEVIRDGVLRSFLYDTTSANRDGVASTGNATRAGFKSAPGPAPSNLAFEGAGERAEVLRRAGRALLVQDFHGVHSGANPVSGDFSVGATGRLVTDGDLGAPVKEITIAAPMLEILRGITAVADDRRWLPFGGSFGGATTLVAEMTIAGQ